MDDRTTKIQTLNDLARTTFRGCRVMVTAGVRELDDLDAVLNKVRAFDAFSEDNDPYGEHDFGHIDLQGSVIFWKFDYYDPDLQMASLDPGDPTITTRVLTIMMADEY